VFLRSIRVTVSAGVLTALLTAISAIAVLAGEGFPPLPR
jgi:hypothetical protein